MDGYSTDMMASAAACADDDKTSGETRAAASMPIISDWTLPFPSRFKKHHYTLGLTVIQQTSALVEYQIQQMRRMSAVLQNKARDMKRAAKRVSGPDIDEVSDSLVEQCAPDGETLNDAELVSVLMGNFRWCPEPRMKALVEAPDQCARWHVLADMMEQMGDLSVHPKLYVWMECLHLCSLMRRIRGEDDDDDDAASAASSMSDSDNEEVAGGGGGGGDGGDAVDEAATVVAARNADGDAGDSDLVAGLDSLSVSSPIE